MQDINNLTPAQMKELQAQLAVAIKASKPTVAHLEEVSWTPTGKDQPITLYQLHAPVNGKMLKIGKGMTAQTWAAIKSNINAVRLETL